MAGGGVIWPEQVLHLLKKDVAEHRWLVLLYLVIIAMAMGHAMGWHPLESPGLSMMMVLVGIIGGMVVASVIQGDSPTRTDAFWASHPIDASAVLASKICAAVLVVGIAMLAQLVVLHWYDLAWSESFRLAGRPAVGFAFGLLGALAVGALTRDMRSFILVALAIPVTLILLGSLLMSAFPQLTFLQFTPGGLAATKLLCGVGEILLLVWIYHSRDGRWLTRIVGYALAALTLFTLVTSLPPKARVYSLTPADVPRIAVRVEPRATKASRNVTDLGIDFVIGPSPAGYRYAIESPKAVVRLRDGSTMHLSLSYALLEFSSSLGDPEPALPLLPGVKWLGADARTESRTPLGATLDADQQARLARGVESISIDASVRVLALTVTDTIPLVQGTDARHGGRLVRVEKWDPHAGRVTLTVLMNNVTGKSPMEATDWIGETGSRYALLNSRRGEGIGLPAAGNGFGVSGIVLPGSTMLSTTSKYGSNKPGNSVIPLDAAWLSDAKLLVITPIPLGSYPVHLESRLP
jgi:hypothetical protein